MRLMFMNDRPRVNETGVFVSGWLGSLSKRTAFPFLAAEEGEIFLDLPLPHPARSFSAALFLRSPDQSVAKRGLQTSRVPGESPSLPPSSSPEAAANSVWEKGRERCPSSNTARYVEQERNYYRRVTYSDVLPLVESSHILHHRA